MPWNETTRKQYTRVSRRYGSDLTDAEWEVLAPLPPPARRGRPCRVDLREIVNAIVRRDLVPILLEDDDREAARAQRSSPVEPAEVSDCAKGKADTRRIHDGLPVHSFSTLLADLGTLTLNQASLPARPDSRFLLASDPTVLQARAFELLGMDPNRDAYISVTA